MNMAETDLNLLEDYTRSGSEKAFTTLVSRHLNLVYSAALRQVGSSQLAEEVSQSVFSELARNAAKFRPDTVLAAWLYQVARRTAIDVVRRESRRQLREKIAVEMADMNTNSAEWLQIEPLLDEAMETLNEPERAAILLRYFENKSLRDVGKTLGVSDDTAQKRVSRAVERLREFFSKRNVTIGASGLVVLISANAVLAAPVGLSALISSSVITTTITIATHTTMHWINLKSVTAILAAAITAGTVTHLVERRETNRLRSENQALMALQKQLTGERDAALSAEMQKSGEIEQSQKDKNELLRLRGEVGVLRRQIFETGQRPKNNNPIRNQTVVAQSATPNGNEVDSFTEISVERKNSVKQIGVAMRLFAMEHKNEFPTDFSQIGEELSPATRNTAADLFEFVQHAVPINDRNNPDKIIIRERIVRQRPDGKWARAYGFADGSASEEVSDTNNFEAWEKQHIISTP